jgi:hypothetical protein
MRHLSLLTTAAMLAVTATAAASDPAYDDAIRRTEAMATDAPARALAAAHGLDLVNVAWEDTGRYANSAVGPNISDLTIQVERCDDRDACTLHLMPVLRHPNFEDVTGDVPLDEIAVLAGNERGAPLERVPLRDLLGNLRGHLTEPGSWPGRATSLLAPRDSHVLVSAQAAFLPIPRGGAASFNPVLFNYASGPGNPAVLTILATPEGTSATIIDNQRDGFAAGPTWGQRLFFNEDGERASLTGKRLSESGGGSRSEGAALSMVMVIQVPLRHESFLPAPMEDGAVMSAAAPMAASGVESAVISHGAVEGPFTEIDGQAIERDPDYPIRVTVQFYKATADGVLTDADVAAMRAEIDRVYADADYVGSLVVGPDRDRPTAHDGPKVEPEGWWEMFRQALARLSSQQW